MPDFKKYFIVPAERELVFAALTFKPTIELWTSSPAVFELKEGSEFSMWDESISGIIISFEQGKMIKQQWHFGDKKDPSIVTLKLHEHKKGTSLEVSHTNIPEQDYDNIIAGWNEVFMKELIEFYDE